MKQIVKVPIKNIKENPNNPRIIKDERFELLVKSIKDFPEMLDKRPLVCFTDDDGKFVVLGGNQRLKAAKEAGMKELPVMLADDWTPEQQREFIVKDNISYGSWDWEMIETEWDIDTLIEWGLEMPEGDEPFEGDINSFFENNNNIKEEKEKIVLEYSQSDFIEVVEAFKRHSGSKEEIVFKLLCS